MVEITKKRDCFILELSGEFLALLEGDGTLAFGFQVGDCLLVFPQVNLWSFANISLAFPGNYFFTLQANSFNNNNNNNNKPTP